MKNTVIILMFLGVAGIVPAPAQHLYSIRAIPQPVPVVQGMLKMGDPGPAGRRLEVNNQYLTLGGKPVLPVMGEIHFSRLAREEWPDVLRKMKADGVTIISTYVFWIYHEPAEGQFNWSGNRDLRYFLMLCARYGLMAVVRIGPWCHGEVRNGGTPDWILEKQYLRDRSNDPVYQHYVEIWYGQVAAQMKGLLYKDGGPVIGVQLENEYRRGKSGEAHIAWLKEAARQAGIDVPLYTVTGWGNASIPKDEVLPLFGGYPGAPWNTDLKRITDNDSYLFSAARNGEMIGNEMNLKDTAHGQTFFRYPYLTCELGIGNEDTYHRRPVFSAIDGLAIATAKLGSGSNLIGYYMFAGGTNVTGPYTSLEEDQDETGYWNRYPKRSYDFQAAIRESGELSPAYFELKRLHYFLEEYGSRLAPMQPVIGPPADPHQDLQYAVRVQGDTGFLFGLNYYRGDHKPVQKQVQFSIQLPSGELRFPSTPVDIPDSTILIWPFNFRMQSLLLHYATASPLCHLSRGDTTDWFFVQTPGIPTELSFNETSIATISADAAKITKTGNHYLLTGMRPGIRHAIRIRDTRGAWHQIFVLTAEEAREAWLFTWKGKKRLVFSKAGLYPEKDVLHLFSADPHIQLTWLENGLSFAKDGKTVPATTQGSVSTAEINLPERHPQLRIRPVSPLGNAVWLETSFPLSSRVNTLWHRYFVREVNLKNTAEIERASLYLATAGSCRIRINGKWVNQSVNPGNLNTLDLTGYLLNGSNTLMMDFPYEENASSFAARLEVTYRNTDQRVLVTDSSWLTTEAYIPPAPWGRFTGLGPARAVPGAFTPVDTTGRKRWELMCEDLPSNTSQRDYLRIRYQGDRSALRLDGQLIDDDFNNLNGWHIALAPYRDLLTAAPLELTVDPLKPGYRIYFDAKPGPPETGTAQLTEATLIPEYRAFLNIKTR